MTIVLMFLLSWNMWIVNTKWLKLAYYEDPIDNMPGEQYSGLIFCVIEIALWFLINGFGFFSSF